MSEKDAPVVNPPTHALPHPITLDKVAFTTVVIHAIPGFDPTSANPTVLPENKINVSKIEGDLGTYSATMTTTINPKREPTGPYSVVVECLGIFHADMSQLSEDEAARGVTITAHSVLYGAIRETVAWLTSRQPHGTLMLGLSVLNKPVPAAKLEDQ